MSADKSHIRAVLASRAHLVYRVDGENRGKHYWAYVLVDQARLNAFKDAMESGAIHVQSYGKILAWGAGDEPPDSIKSDLKNNYDYDIIA